MTSYIIGASAGALFCFGYALGYKRAIKDVRDFVTGRRR